MIGPREIQQALTVLDRLGLHREAVRVPLDGTPSGELVIENGRLVVRLPDDGAAREQFLEGLPQRAALLPGFAGLRRADPC